MWIAERQLNLTSALTTNKPIDHERSIGLFQMSKLVQAKVHCSRQQLCGLVMLLD